jgi:hypothetical protein
VNGWLFVAGVYVGATVIFSSIFLLLRILAWVCTNGLPNMLRLQARAVVEWQDCDPVDAHLVDQPDEVLLTHEATLGVDEFGTPDLWRALENECADLAGLAEQLGERAS